MVDYAALYQQKLGRAPTAGALAYWQGRGAEGVNAFNAAASQEVASRPAATPAATPRSPSNMSIGQTQTYQQPQSTNTNNHGAIKSIYSQYLGRAPESGDVEFWNSQIAGGKTLSQIRSDFGASAEYAQRSAASTKPFIYVDHDNNAATAPVLGNNANSEIKFGYKDDGKWGMLNGSGKPPPQYGGGGAFNYANGPRPASNVAQKIANVTAYDSPMMRQARARGMQSANSRGLINSSIAAQAAESAVLDVAVPIGSQQDSQDFQGNQAHRAFGYNQALQEQQFGHNQALQQQQNNQANKFQGVQNRFDAGQNAINTTVQERSHLSNSTNAAQVAYQNALNNINANTNLPVEVREQQMVSARNRYDAAIDLAERIYNIDLSY